MILYRPVGLLELELIARADFRAFPPRLPEQPIFYPVLTLAYATQMARDWNAQQPPYAGFVTQFAVAAPYIEQFAVQTVGNKTHQELWVPAEALPEFNRHLVGQIAVVASFYGAQFTGEIDPRTNLPVALTKSR